MRSERLPALLQWAGLLIISAGAAMFSVGVALILFGAGVLTFGIAAEYEANNGAR